MDYSINELEKEIKAMAIQIKKQDKYILELFDRLNHITNEMGL